MYKFHQAEGQNIVEWQTVSVPELHACDGKNFMPSKQALHYHFVVVADILIY